MYIFDAYMKNLRDYIGSYKLTISGEIKISDRQGTKLLQLTDDDRKYLKKTLIYLQEKFHYLDVEIAENLVEISVKFFTCDKYISEEKFLEEFRSALAYILQDLNEKSHLAATVSASGSLMDKSKKQQFLFLSKAAMVEYKITDSEIQNEISDVILHKMVVYGVTVLFTALICYNLYVLYKYIPNHDPNMLLVKIIDI